jgi:hypothetical protein
MNELDDPLSTERLRMARETVEAIAARVRGVNNPFAEACRNIARVLGSPAGQRIVEGLHAAGRAGHLPGDDFPP